MAEMTPVRWIAAIFCAIMLAYAVISYSEAQDAAKQQPQYQIVPCSEHPEAIGC